MIVSPSKSVFFVATALMCSASLYGSEVSKAPIDPMARIFVGEPNQLTLPPGFPTQDELARITSCERQAAGPDTQPLQTGSADRRPQECQPERAAPETDVVVSPSGLAGSADVKAEVPILPASVGSAVQGH